MDLAQEIKESVEKLATSVAAIQTEHDAMKGQSDPLADEKFVKMTDDMTKTLDTVNKLTTKQTEQDDLIKEMEIRLAKGGKADDGSLDETAYRKGLAKFLRKGAVDGFDDVNVEALCRNMAEKHFHGMDDEEIDLAVKAMVAGSNPDGGYFLTTDRSSEISKRNFETSPIRALANIMTTEGDLVEVLLDDDEADAGWVGEVQSRDDTDSPQIALIKIPVHELYAQPKATQKMIDDAGFDLEAWLAGKVERRFSRKENNAFVVGDGSQKAKGFLAYAAWAVAGTYERNKVEQITGATASVIGADDLVDLQTALLEDYQAGAAWGMTRTTFGGIAKLKDSNGAYVLNPRIIAEGAEKVLLGRPVSMMADMPEVADSALSVVYADFQEFYTVVDRFGIRVIRDNLTQKPYVKFYTTKRVGGAVTNFEAGKILKVKAA